MARKKLTQVEAWREVAKRDNYGLCSRISTLFNKGLISVQTRTSMHDRVQQLPKLRTPGWLLTYCWRLDDAGHKLRTAWALAEARRVQRRQAAARRKGVR